MIQALVIQRNSYTYICEDGVTVGNLQMIPCTGTEKGSVDGEFWAVPTAQGAFTGFTFSAAASKPTPDSFRVVRISMTNGTDIFWVRGTAAQYNASCAVCCGNTPVPMPTDIPHFAPCQGVCDTDSLGNYFAIWGLPSIVGGNTTFYPTGYYNGTALATAPAAGFTTAAALLSWVSSNWGSVGTWTLSADNLSLKVSQTGGAGTGKICVAVIAKSPSVS